MISRRISTSRLGPSRGKRGGFSLLELLVVVVIIAIVAALAVPGITGMLNTYTLDAATEGVVAQLNLARQTALASNKPVQVRLYQVSDYNGGPAQAWRVMQCFLQGDTSVTPITKPYFFPATAVILTNTVKLAGTDPSSLIDTSLSGIVNVPAGDSANPLPPPYGVAPYVYFLYRSDGQIDQSTSGTTAWSNGWLTVALESAPKQTTGLPANYATIQINAITGTVRVFRP